MVNYTFELGDEAKAYAEENLNETDESRDKAITEILQWMQDIPELNAEQDERLILAFLRGSKFNVEKTKKKLRNYYVMRAEVPEWFGNRDPTLPVIQELVKLGVFVPLRKFHENRLVVVIKTAAHNPGVHSQDDVFKAGKMVLDVACQEDEKIQIYGVTALFDMANVTFSHGRQMTPTIIGKATHAWKNYHCRPQHLEFFNAPSYINVVLNVFRNFMGKKLESRVRVHFGGYDALHKVVDKDILPEEYGGTDGKLQDHIDYWADKIIDYKDWFAKDEMYRADVQKVKENEKLKEKHKSKDKEKTKEKN